VSQWGLFSVGVGVVIGGCLLGYVVLRDIRQGVRRPRTWLSWVGGAIVGLALAALLFLRAET
jgi:hypothetical protein